MKSESGRDFKTLGPCFAKEEGSLNLLQKLYIYEMMYKKNSITDIYRVKITKIDIENGNSVSSFTCVCVVRGEF